MAHWMSKLAMTLAAASMLATLALPKPAAGDTLNSILNTIASIGQQVLFNNFQQTPQPANTVVGYTQNGGTVYGNGRIVMPNGQTFYPNSNGQYSFGQYVYFSPKADPKSFTYDYKRTGQFDRTHRHGKGHAYAYGHNTPPGANPHRGGNGDADKKHGDGDDKHGEKNHGGDKH